MIQLRIPKTNNDPDWLELRVDDSHTARIWGKVTEVEPQPAVHQLLVTVETETLVPAAYLWVDQIQRR